MSKEEVKKDVPQVEETKKAEFILNEDDAYYEVKAAAKRNYERFLEQDLQRIEEAEREQEAQIKEAERAARQRASLRSKLSVKK